MLIADLSRILQTSVAPTILISGVGLLLLSMTNRLGRAIDRSRKLNQECTTPEARDKNQGQLEIIWRRAVILRRAISLASMSCLMASLLIIGLFVGTYFELEITHAVVFAFVACLASLIGAVLYFIRDIYLSLHALALELSFDDSADW